ncbi:glutathione S-transferase family protein [Rhizorhabdus dicambivorans]|uniref:Glutathione S-transferase family protein n=1 Tax=Rhizorhabdus dicambivorans TaxID=1850238 RepID=A0A2A4FVF2_9SPHN|nr:glutathione S-transferase family protein [Rhizorhabdus dicambivorans]ATE63630.1 glutathione S-transferase family protein [Rhizorhabdus dicambivorans]AWQ38077.1 glutathione S-transferase [Rhizorhabdus dicambivorans]PCE42756.1 glutathione S-transferase family protein [Rhizorhabdus dicambivorans]
MTHLDLYNYTMSICSMKTRLAMEELGLDYQDRQVDIGFALENFEPDYVRLNNKCVVPTLVAGDKVVTNSYNIVLEAAQIAGKGLPADPAARETALDWFQKGDQVNFQVITYGRKGVPRGDELLIARRARALEYAEKYPDLRPIYQAAHDRIVEHGNCAYDAETVADAEAGLVARLDELDKHVQGRSFIAGDDYSVADIMWTVLLARVEMLELGGLISERPHLLAYYQRMKARPSFAAARVMPNWKGGI